MIEMAVAMVFCENIIIVYVKHCTKNTPPLKKVCSNITPYHFYQIFYFAIIQLMLMQNVI